VSARRFPTGCVASPHYLASGAGLSVLARGGNAMDAAVAVNLALGVVAPYLCGYGGDLFAMVWDGELHAYNGSGRAPASATPQRVGAERMPTFGSHTVTVPGAVRGWFDLLSRFGSMSFAELAGEATRYAHDGFPLTPGAVRAIEDAAHAFTDPYASAWREVYAEPGAVLRQPALARTIETLSQHGPDPFYEGEIAAAISDTLGGLMSIEDLASHTGDWVEPLRGPFRDLEVCEMPPNTQGVTALEALRIADGVDLPPAGSTGREHVLIEAVKLALSDRDAHVTDPEHMTIGAGELLSDGWISRRRDEIDPTRAGTPAPGRAATGGTAYMCAADANGMLVSLIQSNYMGFGSGVHVRDWGLNLHNRGSFFSLDLGHPNAIGPRKRTMHTLIPAMAFRDGRPWLVFGTMGGDGQAQTHLQLLVRVVIDGLDPQQAVNAPRWVVSPADWSIRIEDRFPDEVKEGLAALGHRVHTDPPYSRWMGHAHAIEVTPHGYVAASDPRAEGAALGL